ncbi:MAG: cation:proton antiporter [Bacteroidetes bacterium]|nr:cation:proton antiporter [Bacteroidota bacterium]
MSIKVVKRASIAALFVTVLTAAFLALQAGSGLAPKGVVSPRGPAAQFEWKEILAAFSHPLAVFILQLVIIIAVSQLFAYLFRKMGQPAVIGEMLAGIALGPSLMGAIAPGFSAFIFPAASLGNLQMLAQVGLILFMFLVGMELDMNLVKKKAATAVLISNAGIIVPYGLGIGLAYFMYKDYAPANVPFYAFALFIGIAMSITAFPVLARIIRERGIGSTKLGVIAMTSAAANDVAGWFLLALVIAIAKAGSLGTSLYTLIAAACYALVMFFIVRPLLKKLSQQKTEDRLLKRSTIALVFVVLLLSSYCSEVIGIHALFGAFIAGVCMPAEWSFRKLIIDKIEDVALVMLLPLFFVFTGLRTQIGLLNDPSLWGMCAVIILVAIAGKFGGSAIVARISGESTHTSLSIGALMNTRGLMELVILNIGYDLGILTLQVFTMMVLMALVTTFMTSPIMSLLDRVYKRKPE